MARRLSRIALLLLGCCWAAGCAVRRPAPEPVAPAEAADPRFETALLAVQGCLRDGDDRTARSILDRVLAQRPAGEAARIAARLDEVLAGREALRSVDLSLRTRVVPEADGGAQLEVWLEARSLDGFARTLRPSAATLFVEGVSIDGAAVETRTEDRTTLPPLAIEAGAEAVRLPLWRGAWSLPPGALGARVVLRLDARAGRVFAGGRDLPAQRIEAAEGAAAMLETSVAEEGPLDSGAFLAEARSGSMTRASALRAALRVPPAAHPGVLAELAGAADLDLDPVLEKLVPAMRWMCGGRQPPKDAAEVRQLLRASSRPAGTGGRLFLPGAR